MNLGATVSRILVGVVIILGLSSSALAQTSGVGSISGTVHDDAGLVMPGVNVVLTNADGTVGGNQETTTDARGVYQFARLVPGSYGVKAALTGFKSTVREQVAVNADVTARVDFTLSIGAISEVITVTSEVQLLDTTTALHQTVMDKEAVQSLPSRNDLWNIAKTVPGLILNKVDVGGTEAFSQSNATVHGAAQTNEGAFTIDGFEFGSALNAGASLAMYVAPSSFQEVNYQTGNASAESQRGGLVYNLVTRTGTNQFRGDANFSGSRGGLQAENITDSLRRDFLAALPARVLAANPDFTPSGKIRELYDAAFALSGPIVRDKLWFSATIARASLDQLKVGSYNPDGTRYLDRNRKRAATIKISYQMTSKQQLYVYHQENQKIAYNFRANTCYGEVRPPSFLTFNPRAAFIYDLFGNGGTAIKVTANRYDIRLGNPYVERISPVQLTNDTRPWTDANRDQIPQLSELGSSSGYALGNSNRYATDLKRPYAVELSAEVEHQSPGRSRCRSAITTATTRGTSACATCWYPPTATSP
jgi:hypothetical protein